LSGVATLGGDAIFGCGVRSLASGNVILGYAVASVASTDSWSDSSTMCTVTF
jgi:hypothetical protein